MSKNPITAEQRERLKQTLASGSRLGASDLRLINIDVYKERLGGNWFKYKGIIHAYAAEAIKTELGPDDFFVETKTGYGIFFFKKDIDEVQTISARIAERLSKQLSREPIFGDPPLGCEATSVNCDEFLKQLEKEEPPPPPPRKPVAAAPVAASAVKYTPLWDAKLERVVGSIGVPQAPKSRLRQSDVDYYNPTPEQVQADIAAFNATMADAYKLHKAGIGATVVFSVNFKAFCTPQFNKDYMAALRQAPGQLLPFLTPRFVRIAPGTPQTLLASKVQLMATIFRRVVLQTKPVLDLAKYEFVPCALICTTWSEIERMATPDRTPLDIAKGYREAARRLRVNAVVEGIATLAALDTAAAAGIEFVSGPQVGDLSAAPAAQSAVSLSTLRARGVARPAPAVATQQAPALPTSAPPTPAGPTPAPAETDAVFEV